MNIKMKKAFYTLVACLLALGFSACSDDNDALTDTTLTNYVNLILQGDEFVEVPLGSSYTDAGCKATLAGEEFTNITVEGLDEIDVNTPGLYEVTYTATNPDGYVSSVSRTVAVCDPTVTTDISGIYAVQTGSYRYWFSSGATVPFADQTVTIKKAASGIFYISDLMGGYYDQRAGYGSKYAMNGYIQLTNENELFVLSGYVPGWGDSYDDFYDGSYDPDAQTLTYELEYAGSMQFHIILGYTKSL